MSWIRLVNLFCLFVLLFAAPAAASDVWPEFRGPGGQGHSDSTGLPLEWSEDENVAWKTAVHGKGWSTPVVWGDQVWLTTATADGTKMSAICVDRNSGKVLLDRLIFENAPDDVEPLGNPVNAYSSPSPAIDGERVYLHWGSYGTAALDTKTFKELWRRRDLPAQHFRGPGSSVVMFGDTIILTMDGVDHQYLVALNKKTGETAWKTQRNTDFGDLTPEGEPKAGGDFRKAYTTPTFAQIGDRIEMLSCGAKAAYAYDPATGEVLWSLRYKGFSNASRPVFSAAVGEQGMWFINTGYSRSELWAVKPGGSGDITDTHVVWQAKRNIPLRTSPVVVNGLLFAVDDGGIAQCIDGKTGDAVWRTRLGDGKAQYAASPVYANGRVYFFDWEGLTTVVEPSRELNVLATNRLDGGFMASPAIAGKAFFLRTKTHLYRVEK